MHVATIIRDQLEERDPNIFEKWGATGFVDLDDGLGFNTSEPSIWKGHVYIQYDRKMNHYNLIFLKITNNVSKIEKQLYGVYTDKLITVISRFLLSR